VAIVEVSGEIDIATEPEVIGVFSTVLADQPRGVVVDLSGVSFMDCAGLRALSTLRARGQRVGINPVLAAVPAPVTRLLTLADLGGDFMIRASVREAMATARAAGRDDRDGDSTGDGKGDPTGGSIGRPMPTSPAQAGR
jgi:anti-anti-sigma factor